MQACCELRVSPIIHNQRFLILDFPPFYCSLYCHSHQKVWHGRENESWWTYLVWVWLFKVNNIKMAGYNWSCSVFIGTVLVQLAAKLQSPTPFALKKSWDIDMRTFYLRLSKNHDLSQKVLLQARGQVGEYFNSAKSLFFLVTGNRRNRLPA